MSDRQTIKGVSQPLIREKTSFSRILRKLSREFPEKSQEALIKSVKFYAWDLARDDEIDTETRAYYRNWTPEHPEGDPAKRAMTALRPENERKKRGSKDEDRPLTREERRAARRARREGAAEQPRPMTREERRAARQERRQGRAEAPQDAPSSSREERRAARRARREGAPE